SRSSTPSKATIRRPWCGRTASISSGPALAGSVTSTDPGTYRVAGSSVVTSTTTSPRMPCGRAIRPMTSCIGKGSVRVDDVDAYPTAADRGDHLAQRLGGTAATPDDRPEVLGVDAYLQALPTPGVDHPDPYLVRVV